MKKFAMIVFLICVALITTSCNSTKVFYYGSNFGNEIKATYKYFTGTEKKNIELKEGDVLKMEYESVVKEGTLLMRIVDPNEEVITEFEADQTGSFEFVTKTPGRYQLTIIGDSTKGSFHFTWKIEK